MANAIFLTPEASDGGSIVSESSGAASMPASMVQKIQPTDRWRTTALNPAFFEMDMGADQSVDFVAALFTNASNTASWRVRLAATQANLVTAPDYDSGNMDHWPHVGLDGWQRNHAIHDLGSTVVKRWIRVDVKDLSNADGYYEMGRFYAGLKFQPTYNVDFGSGYPMFREEKIRLRAEGGLTHPIQRPRGRFVEGNFTFHSEAELNDNFQSLSRLRGISQDLLYVFDPASANYAHNGIVYGLMDEPVAVRIPENSTFALSFSIEEML